MNNTLRWRTEGKGKLTSFTTITGVGSFDDGKHNLDIRKKVLDSNDNVISEEELFNRNFIQRKLAITPKPDVIDYTIGDELNFDQYSTIWNETYNGLSGTSTENDDPHYTINIYYDETIIATSGDLSGSQLAWNWTWDGSLPASVTSTLKNQSDITSRLQKGKTVKLIPIGSDEYNKMKYFTKKSGVSNGKDEGTNERTDEDNYSSRKEDEEIPLYYEIVASAKGHNKEDIYPISINDILGIFFTQKTKINPTSSPIDVVKIFVDSGLDLLDADNKKIDVSWKKPHFQDVGPDKRLEPCALVLETKRNQKVRVLFKAKNIALPSEYIIQADVILNDQHSQGYGIEKSFIRTTKFLEFTSKKNELDDTYSIKENTLIIPDTIQYVTRINWYCRKKNADGSIGGAIFCETTPVYMFVLMKDPIKPQKKPRRDILYIACASAEGEKVDEYRIKDKFLDFAHVIYFQCARFKTFSFQEKSFQQG